MTFPVNLKLGKQPAAPKPTDFKLTRYAVDIPTPTKRFGYGTLFHRVQWGMLGNDRAGDCVWAGAAHETMLWTFVARNTVTFSDQVVLADYATVTGYDPTTGANDNGTDVHDAMSYRRATGIADANGTRHKIDAYASIDPHDWDKLLEAVWAFGAAGIGFNFPRSAWAQFDAEKPWDVVDNDGGLDGGHYVPAVGSLNPANEISVITWGRRQRMTKAFYERYTDETWVPLSLEVLHANQGLHHLNVDQLRSDLATLG